MLKKLFSINGSMLISLAIGICLGYWFRLDDKSLFILSTIIVPMSCLSFLFGTKLLMGQGYTPSRISPVIVCSLVWCFLGLFCSYCLYRGLVPGEHFRQMVSQDFFAFSQAGNVGVFCGMVVALIHNICWWKLYWYGNEQVARFMFSRQGLSSEATETRVAELKEKGAFHPS